MAKRDGRRVADVVNSALAFFIEKVNKVERDVDEGEGNRDIFILRNDGDITLSKQDVMGIEREVGVFRIENTGRLVFDKDMDREALKYIDSIVVHSGTVEVPRNLYPHFLIRSEIHGKVEKY